MSRLGPLVLLLALVLGVAACGGGDDSGGESTPEAAPPSAAETAGCEKVDAPAPKQNADLPKPKEKLKAGGTYVATVDTSCGTFKIALDAKQAPRTGGSFKYLADKGFYDGLTFHRIVAGFVIQGGDPKGDGTGGPGYTVVEKPPANLKYTKGVVAMAKGGTDPAGSAGSQFFVVTGADAGLPPEYALVGNVSEGMDVVEEIGEVPVEGETPKQTVLIEHVEIERG
jgi:peptidyl-prolyl cis-trans isomerase B (cyclophilin B)